MVLSLPHVAPNIVRPTGHQQLSLTGNLFGIVGLEFLVTHENLEVAFTPRGIMNVHILLGMSRRAKYL